MISRSLSLALLILAAGVAAAEDLTPDLAVRELTPGVWVHTSKDANGVPANGLLVRTKKGLLLVDTGWKPEQTERLVTWAKDRHQPVIGAIVTHSHADRMGGLSVLRRHGVPTGALDLTVAKAKAAGGDVPTVLLTSDAPNLVDPRGVIVFYPGPGHVADNIVVYLPAARVLFGGCLVKSPLAPDLGFVGEADLVRWPEAIRRVQSHFPEAKWVVPGHGEVGGPEALGHTADLLAARTSGGR
jgi:metallo-beta-lactamase class B